MVTFLISHCWIKEVKKSEKIKIIHLKRIKGQVKSEDRTILLTTHHLEEAEKLAERICIMSKGKLLTLGTSEFIKKNFGVGYHLEISAAFLEESKMQQPE